MNSKGEKSTFLRNCYHQACIDGDLATIKNISPDLINAKDNDGNTCLHLAVIHEHVEIVRFIHSCKNVNLMANNPDSSKPLEIACKKRNLEIIQILANPITVNIIIDYPSIENVMPMESPYEFLTQSYMREKDYEVVSILAPHDERVDYGYKRTPLILAVQMEDERLVQMFLNKKLNNINYIDETALSIACMKENYFIIKMIMASPFMSLSRDYGELALRATINNKERSCLELLLAYLPPD